MPELTAEGREEVREFLRQERRSIFIAGGISFGTLIIVVGGFLAFLWSQIELRSEAAANVAAQRAISNAELVIKLQEGAISAINDAKEQIGEARASTEGHNKAALQAREEIETTLRRFRSAEDTLKALTGIRDELDAFVETILDDDNFQEAFEAQIASVRFPVGAVVAFNSSSAFGACPIGWSLFTQAGGRTIIGAGSHSNANLSTYPSFADDPTKATGGQEAVTLTVDQIPPHKHALPSDRLGSGDMQTLVNTNNKDEALAGSSQFSAETGKGQSHNNMPPYIALFYCIKD